MFFTRIVAIALYLFEHRAEIEPVLQAAERLVERHAASNAKAA